MSAAEVNTYLLGFISVLLTIIGVFLIRFYDQVQALVKEFHQALLEIARHDERIENLETQIDP